MRIAFVGAGGTGKSTLVNFFSKNLNYPIIPEYAREACLKLGIDNPQNLKKNQIDEFQNIISEYKIKEERKHKSFIADRTIADGLAYHLLRYSGKIKTEFELKNYRQNVKQTMINYDLIFFVEWGVLPIENDGFRILDPNKQLTIHFLIKGILHDLNIPYVSIYQEKIEDRIQYIKKIIQKHKK